MILSENKLLWPSKFKLKKGQAAGARHLMSGNRKLLLDDPGLCKTATAVMAFNSLGAKRGLILCPPSVRFHWANEIRAWSVRGYSVQVITKEKTTLDGSDITICPYNLLASPMIYRQCAKKQWPFLILDEIHYCKNDDALRTSQVLGGKSGDVKYPGLWRNSVYTWGLSGTPFTKTPIDLWPVARSIGRKTFNMKWMTFTAKFCGRFRTKYGWDVSGATKLDELRQLLFDSGLALRRTKEHRDGNQLRLIHVDKAADVWDERLDRLDFHRPKLGLDAGAYAQLRKEIGLSKLDLASSYVLDAVDPGGKLLVFAWHQEVVERLAADLEPFYNTAIYYGKQTHKQKEIAKNEFIEGDAEVCIANIDSIGTGTDGMQRRCHRSVFVEVPWNWTQIKQCIGRLDREGQEHPVLSDILLIGDSIEDYILSRVMKKERCFELTFG